MKGSPCRGCRYYVLLDNRRGRRVCYYIVMEGHRRPCPPGAGCTVRLEGEDRSSLRAFEL